MVVVHNFNGNKYLCCVVLESKWRHYQYEYRWNNNINSSSKSTAGFSGFSIIQYTGTGTNGATVGHGLTSNLQPAYDNAQKR